MKRNKKSSQKTTKKKSLFSLQIRLKRYKCTFILVSPIKDRPKLVINRENIKSIHLCRKQIREKEIKTKKNFKIVISVNKKTNRIEFKLL